MEAESETAFRYANQQNLHGFYWIDNNLAFVIIGEINKEQLSDAAHIVYTAHN